MISYFKVAIFVIVATAVPLFSAHALDFDNDGFDDVVTVAINSDNTLEWFAQDLNDTARRSLGRHGVVGDHIAAGNWSSKTTASTGVVSKTTSGSYVWKIDLASGQKSISFGALPATVVSGLDYDNNGSIDPTVVAVGTKYLNWKILSNPALSDNATVRETNFGGTKTLPFYANLDGKGDQIGYASVNKKNVLAIRLKSLTTGKIKQLNVLNFKSTLSDILPVKGASGKDVLFVVSRSGATTAFTIIDGKKIKKVSVSGDKDAAIIVGNYFATDSDVVAVRKNSNAFTLVTTAGKKVTVNLSISGILVDDVNINSFAASTTPGSTPAVPAPRSPAKTNPVCSGVMDSTLNLLYKPASDTTGNAVIVFDGPYKLEFQTVAIQLKDGTFTQAFWKGLALWGNPDKYGLRQHWRTSVKSSQIANNAIIIANDGAQECRYALPGASNRRWE